MKTADLTGAALDWAVAKCVGFDNGDWIPNYSTEWYHGNAIIESEEIAVWPGEQGGWFASANEGAGKDYHADTLLIAAMRCYVASKLGDEVEVPEELLSHA